MRYLNNLLTVDIGPEIFLTIWYGELNLNERCLTYVNAAHIPPIIYRNETSQLEELVLGEKSLGRLENIELEKHRVKIEKEDLLIFYNNGMIKALEEPGVSGDGVLRSWSPANIIYPPRNWWMR